MKDASANKRDDILSPAERLKVEKSPKVAMLDLYDALQKRLKRHAPRDYITWMAKRLADAWVDDRKFVQTPPHWIIHSIEANCAYWKDGYREPVTWDAVRRVMNTYHGHTDPYQFATILEEVNRVFLLMYREQMELQKRASWDRLLRTSQLFVRYHSMEKVSKEFYYSFAITPDQWVKICFLCWMISTKESGGSFLVKLIENSEIGISQEVLENFLEYSAWSPEEIGQNYREVRENEPYEYHSLIRSCFFNKPIVRFSDGSMIVPHTHLLFLHAGQGLYRLLQNLDIFAPNFSDSFEAYVRMVLEELKKPKSIIGSNELEKAASSKSCDFLVETETTIILVECKACVFTSNRLHDEAIRNNNSTAKVAKGLTQLYSTAQDLENGRFDTLKINREKPTVGIVLTFGEIPSANSEWYFEEFFLKRADKKLDKAIYPSTQMTRRPVVLNIASFERLVAVLNSSKKTLQALYDERETEGYHITGDWGIWLSSNCKRESQKSLGFLEKLKNEFLTELGMGADHARIDKDLRIGKIAKVVSDSPT